MKSPQASTDHGTVLNPGDFAIAWSPLFGWRLIVPEPGKAMKPGAVMPAEALALTGAFFRLEGDPDFRAECEAWFKREGKG